tara:strand:+ start:33 stop:641 length:609 start_codon:yes stop_codon:yes gene_type:complete
MIIFHDSLSDEFINLYQTDKIKFIKKDISSYENSSINDIRFLIYLEYLKVQNNIDKICLVDAFDVVIKKNPFKMINKENYLYACGEAKHGKETLLKDSSWIKDRYKSAFNQELEEDVFLKKYLNSNAINAGVLGGTYNTIIQLLEKSSYFFSISNKNINSNMAVINRASFTLFGENIHLGPPFCTQFRSNQGKRTDCCIRHK